jgi:hypothetical protein
MNPGMKRYFSKLIGRRNLIRLSGATAGSLVGLFIIMFTVQLWFDAAWFRNHDSDDLFSPGMLVINKKVTLMNTLGISDNTFGKEEIASIRAKDFVNRAEPFEPCQFKVAVKIELGGMEIPDLVSEFFFESVPDELVDIPAERWQWDTASSVLPVVLPADFLKFYNFGFAPGQNLPQLSEKSLRMATLDIQINGNGHEEHFTGRIAGLSEKINTILVPRSFLLWANERFGDRQSRNPARLVVVSRVAADPNLANFIRIKGYETNQSELRSGRLNQLLQVSLIVTGTVGIIIIILALYMFILSFRLFIVRSDYEIRTLIQLGVPHISITRYLFGMLGFVVTALFFIDSLVLFFIHGKVFSVLSEKGINIMPSVHSFTWLLSALVMLILLVANYMNISSNIRKITH